MDESWGGKGYHVFPSELFCLTVPKNFVGGTLLCFRKFLVSKIFMYGRGGITVLSIFLSDSAQKFRGGNLLCFEKNSGIENFHALEGGGGGYVFVDFFCLTVPKNFVEEPFSIRKNFKHRNFLHKGDLTNFSQGVSTIFCRLFYVSPKLS